MSSSRPAGEHSFPRVVSCVVRFPLPALGVLTRAGVSASTICLDGTGGRTIGSPAVRPARIDSNSQERTQVPKKANGLCPVRAMRQTARDGDPRTPSPCCLQHGVRYGHYGRPPFDKQPGQGTRVPQEAYGPNFGSGVTTPHLAPWAIVAPVLFWAASAMVLRCR